MEKNMERQNQLNFLIKDSQRKGITNPIFRLRERQYRQELVELRRMI
jgi:hypothetical protein